MNLKDFQIEKIEELFSFTKDNYEQSNKTAYLKAHFPEEFLVSSMNLSINKTENLVMFKKEIDENKINFFKPDINFSDANFKIEIDKKNIKSIRFGLAAVKGVGYNAMLNLKEERKKSKYKNIFDFITRLKSDVINKKQLEKLIQSGSFDSIEKNRSFLFLAKYQSGVGILNFFK